MAGDTTAPADTVGWTLRGWEQRARLAIFDRAGSFLGRLSADGILQRFHPRVDAEYDIDLISSGFTLSEEYDWFRRRVGARFWAGSVNHRRLVQEGELKARVPLGDTWAFRVDVFHHQTLQADRSLLVVEFAHTLFDGRGTAFMTGTLKEDKPDADLELGFTWTDGPASVTVGLAALDAFNDFIYQTLEVFPGFADTAIDYRKHPIALRGAAELRLAPELRAEAFGLVLTPTRLHAERQEAVEEGFRQNERYGYAGGLIEWSPTPRSAVGAFGTWHRARTERTPLAAGDPEDVFDLREREWQAGAYGIYRPHAPFGVEARVARRYRDHDRLRPPAAAEPSLDYRDRDWWGRIDATYRPRSGFRGTVGIDFVARDVLGPDRVDTDQFLDEDNWRLRVDLGWEIGRRAMFRLGTNFDLDGDVPLDRGIFDGAHGMFAIYW